MSKNVINILKSHLTKYIYTHFENNEVSLPEDLHTKLEKKLSEILHFYVRPTLYQKIIANFDLLTLREVNLEKILGLDNSIKIIRRSLEVTFEIISTEEPTEVILNFLKSRNKFFILIEFSFKNYIERSIKKRFPFLKSIPQEKKEIIFSKVFDIVLNNYDYYKNYNPNKSRFKTFLYKDIIFAAIKVFREENFNYYQIVLNKDSYLEYIQQYDITLKNTEIAEWQTKTFSSRSELSDWMENEIDNNSLMKFGKYIWQYVKNIEHYTNIIDYIDVDNVTPVNSEFWENESNFITVENKKTFLMRLKDVEKDPIPRLILKIVLGLDINYLSNEVHLVFKNSIDLALVKKLHKLLKTYGIEVKTNFYNEIYFLLKKKSSNFLDVVPGSIQRRVNRNFKKIQKIYSSNELNDIIMSITKSIDKNLFEHPPIFLKLINMEDIRLLFDKEVSSSLRIVDLSNNFIEEVPKEIFEIKTLQEIDLSNNMLERIPKGFAALENLRVINLKDQFISKNLSHHSPHSLIQIPSDDINWIKSKLPNCKIVT